MTGRNRQNQPAKTYLRLTAEEPSKEGGVWRVISTVLVSRSGKTVDGETIQFFVDGVRYGSAVRTDADGRVQQIITVPLGTRRVSVEAQIEGQPWVTRDTVVFPAEAPPAKPHSFEVDLVGGSGGTYRIVGLVRNENNAPVKNGGVRILDAESGTIVRTLHTDERGNFMLIKQVPDDVVLELEVWVLGLHAKNNPTLLRMPGKNQRPSVGSTPERVRPTLDIVGAFQRGRGKVR